MVLGVRLVRFWLKEPVPVWLAREEVETFVKRAEELQPREEAQYAKPLAVMEAPPVAEMLALKVAVEVETPVAAEVVRVGVTIIVMGALKLVEILPAPSLAQA